MRKRDLAEVMEIERVSYPKPWSEEIFRSEIEQIADGSRAYLVVRDGSELLGYGGLIFQLDDAHVSNIATAPSRRRRGVGRRLLAELGWAARSHGSQAMTLEVRHSNTAAQRLYESFGFETVGVRTRYYEGVDDALVMWRNGIGDPEFGEVLAAWCPDAAVGR